MIAAIYARKSTEQNGSGNLIWTPARTRPKAQQIAQVARRFPANLDSSEGWIMKDDGEVHQPLVAFKERERAARDNIVVKRDPMACPHHGQDRPPCEPPGQVRATKTRAGAGDGLTEYRASPRPYS